MSEPEKKPEPKREPEKLAPLGPVFVFEGGHSEDEDADTKVMRGLVFEVGGPVLVEDKELAKKLRALSPEFRELTPDEVSKLGKVHLPVKAKAPADPRTMTPDQLRKAGLPLTKQQLDEQKKRNA